MKAIYLPKRGGIESLVTGDLPIPQPKAGEVLVKVHAAAVTPAELEWHPTFHTASGGDRPFPIVPGHEFSGVIAGLGPGVGEAKVGDAVFGLNDWFTNGAQAEFVTASVGTIAAKPAAISHEEASVVPISALTAWQGLVARAGLKTGERILIHGAAGGVGVFAVQIARLLGAHVIATASERNLGFVRDLGADVVIDYRHGRFEDTVCEADVIFDAVGGETLGRSWQLLAPGGRLVTVATSSSSSPDPRVKEAFMLVSANRMDLDGIRQMIDAGRIRVFVGKTFPLLEAPAAYARAAKGGIRGKVTLAAAD